MDAYNIHEKLLTEWRQLVLGSGADTIKKVYNNVPVYIELNDSIYTVSDVSVKNGKIFLEIK
jgi:hypothetical protein